MIQTAQGPAPGADAILDLPDADLSELPAARIDHALGVFAHRRQPEAALALVRRAAALGIAYPFPLPHAACFDRHGDRATALAMVQAWQPADAAPPLHHVQKALAHYNFGDWDSGRALLDAAVEKYPKAPNVVWAKARRAHLEDDIETAIAFYGRARKLNPRVAGEVDLILQALDTGRAAAMGFDLSLPRDLIDPGVLLGLLSGDYEKAEREAILADLAPGDRFLELGTGAGIVAMSVARAFPEVAILTVEANPDLIPLITENFARNGCAAQLVEGLAALEDGVGTLYRTPAFPGSSTRLRADEDSQAVTVATVDVNRLIAEFRPSVMTIDIEGAEVDILPRLHLDGVRRLIVEFHPDLCSPAEISRAFAHLLARGYMLDLGPGNRNVFVFARPGGSSET